MKIAVCCKITPDIESVQVDDSGNLNIGRAQWEISQYDLQAIQAAMDIAQPEDEVVCVTVGNEQVAKSNNIKALLSRGPGRLVAVQDDALYGCDTAQTAQVIAAVAQREQFDVMLFGEGSADAYAQQVGAYVGAILGWPSVNAAIGIDPVVDGFEVRRDLEGGIQSCSISMPCVISVSSSINEPPIPAMRAILQAGKKPVDMLALAEVGVDGVHEKLQTVAVSATEVPNRKNVMLEGTPEEMASQLVTYLKQENVL